MPSSYFHKKPVLILSINSHGLERSCYPTLCLLTPVHYLYEADYFVYSKSHRQSLLSLANNRYDLIRVTEWPPFSFLCCLRPGRESPGAM